MRIGEIKTNLANYAASICKEQEIIKTPLARESATEIVFSPADASNEELFALYAMSSPITQSVVDEHMTRERIEVKLKREFFVATKGTVYRYRDFNALSESDFIVEKEFGLEGFSEETFKTLIDALRELDLVERILLVSILKKVKIEDLVESEFEGAAVENLRRQLLTEEKGIDAAIARSSMSDSMQNIIGELLESLVINDRIETSPLPIRLPVITLCEETTDISKAQEESLSFLASKKRDPIVKKYQNTCDMIRTISQSMAP